MEQFEYHQTAGLGLRTRAYYDYVHYKIGLDFPFLCWINVSLTAWMQIGWTARWSSLEERPISWASVGRKTFLFVCLPGVTLKHCFLAGLTLSIDHIFLLWEACFNHILLPWLIQSSRKKGRLWVYEKSLKHLLKFGSSDWPARRNQRMCLTQSRRKPQRILHFPTKSLLILVTYLLSCMYLLLHFPPHLLPGGYHLPSRSRRERGGIIPGTIKQRSHSADNSLTGILSCHFILSGWANH